LEAILYLRHGLISANIDFSIQERTERREGSIQNTGRWDSLSEI
jgi:hypothetical protein